MDDKVSDNSVWVYNLRWNMLLRSAGTELGARLAVGALAGKPMVRVRVCVLCVVL